MLAQSFEDESIQSLITPAQPHTYLGHFLDSTSGVNWINRKRIGKSFADFWRRNLITTLSSVPILLIGILPLRTNLNGRNDPKIERGSTNHSSLECRQSNRERRESFFPEYPNENLFSVAASSRVDQQSFYSATGACAAVGCC